MRRLPPYGISAGNSPKIFTLLTEAAYVYRMSSQAPCQHLRMKSCMKRGVTTMWEYKLKSKALQHVDMWNTINELYITQYTATKSHKFIAFWFISSPLTNSANFGIMIVVDKRLSLLVTTRAKLVLSIVLEPFTISLIISLTVWLVFKPGNGLQKVTPLWFLQSAGAGSIISWSDKACWTIWLIA